MLDRFLLKCIQIFMRMGIPRVLTTDNGTEFKNQLDTHLAEALGIKRIYTTPYHPQVCYNMINSCIPHIEIKYNNFLSSS